MTLESVCMRLEFGCDVRKTSFPYLKNLKILHINNVCLIILVQSVKDFRLSCTPNCESSLAHPAVHHIAKSPCVFFRIWNRQKRTNLTKFRDSNLFTQYPTNTTTTRDKMMFMSYSESGVIAQFEMIIAF